MFRGELDLLLIATFEREHGNAAKRRVAQFLSKLDLLFVVTGKVMAAGELDGGMKWREALHEHLAFDVPAASPAGDLREQLKRALARAEVGLMQRHVRIDDADEGDVRKVQAFRDHLRADEDID